MIDPFGNLLDRTQGAAVNATRPSRLSGVSLSTSTSQMSAATHFITCKSIRPRVTIFIGFWVGLLGCEQTNSPSINVPRTIRQYQWTRDTIGDGTYQSTPTGIWGSSNIDVYVVGHSSVQFGKKIWHFNGEHWSDITAVYGNAFQGINLYSFIPEAVFGFSTSDVWIVGGRDTSWVSSPYKEGFILHYDGANWSGVSVPNSSLHTTVWGFAKDDLWVGGLYGNVFHFDGQLWESRQLPDSIIVHTIDGFAPNEVFASGIWFPNGNEQVRYYRWNGTNWTLQLSRDLLASNVSSTFSPHKSELYSTGDHDVSHSADAVQWQIAFSDPSATFNRVNAIDPNALVAYGRGADGNELLYHFNGSDWLGISGVKHPGGRIVRAWGSGSSLFLISHAFGDGTTWPRSYILRGQ